MQTKPLGLTRILARFIVDTDQSEISPDIIEHAKIALMDWIAVTHGGKDDPLVKKIIKYSDIMGGNEQATILGYGVKKTVSQAALINGAASHALDFDDTLEIFIGHPSVTLFPSLLALAEWKGLSGLELLTAYLIGLKTGAVIASCGGYNHYMSGWHGTSTYGHFASAAGCARLLGLNEQQAVYALGIAGTQAAGLRKVFGTMCKPFHAGKSSKDGLLAAMLADEGFTSAEDILEGEKGFIDVFNGKMNNNATDTLGKTWEVENLAQKYHASCHATHSPIEGVYSIMADQGLNIQDIKSIKVKASTLALDAAGKIEPKSGLDGKFCIPYCVANALLRGDTGANAFTDEKVNDPLVREYMRKISVHVQQDYKMVESKVEIELNSGEIYTKVVDILKDIPELGIKQSKIENKFVDLCSPGMGADKTSALINIINSLETIDNIQTLTKRL